MLEISRQYWILMIYLEDCRASSIKKLVIGVLFRAIFETQILQYNNKRSSRTAIFFVNVADKKFDRTNNKSFSHTSQTWPKKSRWGSCWKNSSRILQRLISLRIDILTTLFEPFCIFNLSTFQSKGNSQNMFHQKDVTVNWDPDRRIQKCCFHEGRGAISR